MGLFSKKQESEEQIAERLCKDAGHVIEMFKSVFTKPQGFDARGAVIFVSALTGYACHQAVVANKEPVQLLETNDGRKFYFGDSVNKYLLESKLNTVGMVAAVTGISADDIHAIVIKCVSVIGDNSYTIGGVNPDWLYKEIKNCWNGIYNNMTGRYCKSPSEWPILFGIVTQNIVNIAVSGGAPKEEAGKLSAEAMIYMSKYDDDSLL